MKKYNEKGTNEGGAFGIIPLFKTVGLSYLFTLVIFAVISLFLCYTEFPETIINSAVILTTIISIMFGGTYIARKAKTRGWMHGSIVGLLYMIILYLLGSFSGKGFQINQYFLSMMIAGIAAGAIGGIVGINIRKR